MRARWQKTFAAAAVFGLAVVLAPGAETVVTILHTTDLHGWLRPSYASGRGDGQAGGMLRVATVLKRLKAAAPDALLLDCGDMFQGGPESRVARGETAARAAKYIGYDALVVGNHDFDWGVKRAAELFAAAGALVLAGNMRAVGDGPAAAPPAFECEAYFVRSINGVKVAVVGLTTPLIPRWFLPHMLGHLRFLPPAEALREILPRVRAHEPDILVLAMHMGFTGTGDDEASMLNAIARDFPDFDVIIGGHTHQTVELRLTRGIPFTQAGEHGCWVGKVEIRFDIERRRVTHVDCFLEPVSEKEPEDSGLLALLTPAMQQTERLLSEQLGSAECEMPPQSEFPGQSSVQALFAAAILEAVPADAVFHGTLTGAGLFKGKIERRDVWRIIPYENEICILNMDAQGLKAVLEDNARFFGTTQFRGVSGLVYELNPAAADGSRVGRIFRPDGRELAGTEAIRLAVNSYDAASAGNRFPALREAVDAALASGGLRIAKQSTLEAVENYIVHRRKLCEKPVLGAIVK